MGVIINGKGIAESIQNEIKLQLSLQKGRPPCLAVILVGDHPASHLYVKRKMQSCQWVGIRSLYHNLSLATSEKALVLLIESLNKDPEVDGILVQLPLPPSIDRSTVVNSIAPDKDVDGLHPMNAGKLLLEDPSGFVPCTPLGIKVLLERAKIPVLGKHVVILGRSNLVGKPLAALLMQNQPGANATVTVAHSRTTNIKEICRSANVLVSAIGQPKFVSADMVNSECYVIDVGINSIDGKIVGDVDFAQVKEVCAAITPVPGGVGPMTIAMLLSNTLKSYFSRI